MEAHARFRLVLPPAALLAVLQLTALPAPPAAAAQTPGPAAAGGGPEARVLYRRACANCHGADGGGAPATRAASELALPDFSDCNFASREPSADWVAVAHRGGPVRGFGRMMPAFGEALTVEEIGGIVRYVRGFCGNADWPRGELNLPRPMFTEKAYPEDEAVWTTAAAAEGRGSVMNEVTYERRFGARNQLELVVPFGAQEAGPSGGGDWRGGLGDAAVGWKRVLFHDLDAGSILSLTGEVILPTGDESDGFGKGTTVLEPFLSYGQLLPAGAFLHAQGGFEIPARGKLAEEAFWRAAVGRTFAEDRWGRAWSPMVEVLGKRELAEGAQVHWDLVPQLQVTLNTRQHVMANVAVRIPVNDRAGRSTEVLVYLLWDYFDGGFLAGW